MSPGIKPLNDEQKKALRLFSDSTRGWCNTWELAGDRNSDTRQTIMSALSGRKVPKKDCGVTALTEKLREILDVADGATFKVVEEIATKIKERLK